MTWMWLYPAAGCLIVVIGIIALERRRRELEAWAEKRRIELNARETFLLAEQAEVREKHALWNWKWAHFRMAIEEMFDEESMPGTLFRGWANAVQIQEFHPGMERVTLPTSERLQQVVRRELPIFRVDSDLARHVAGAGFVVRVDYDGQTGRRCYAVDRRFRYLIDELPFLEDIVRQQVRSLATRIANEGSPVATSATGNLGESSIAERSPRI